MYKRTFKKARWIDGTRETWARVDRKAARRAAENGERVAMHACNMSPYYGDGVFVAVYNPDHDGDFDRFADLFQLWNCTGSETGNYPAFYLTA